MPLPSLRTVDRYRKARSWTTTKRTTKGKSKRTAG